MDLLKKSRGTPPRAMPIKIAMSGVIIGSPIPFVSSTAYDIRDKPPACQAFSSIRVEGVA
jgi:hypothetical protein